MTDKNTMTLPDVQSTQEFFFITLMMDGKAETIAFPYGISIEAVQNELNRLMKRG